MSNNEAQLAAGATVELKHEPSAANDRGDSSTSTHLPSSASKEGGLAHLSDVLLENPSAIVALQSWLDALPEQEASIVGLIMGLSRPPEQLEEVVSSALEALKAIDEPLHGSLTGILTGYARDAAARQALFGSLGLKVKGPEHDHKTPHKKTEESIAPVVVSEEIEAAKVQLNTPENKEKLQSWLDNLPYKERQAINLMTGFSGTAYQIGDITEQLRLSDPAIYTRKNKALEALKAIDEPLHDSLTGILKGYVRNAAARQTIFGSLGLKIKGPEDDPKIQRKN